MKPSPDIIQQVAKLKFNSTKDWMIAVILLFNVVNSLGGMTYGANIVKSLKELPAVIQNIEDMKRDIQNIQDILVRNKIAFNQP